MDMRSRKLFAWFDEIENPFQLQDDLNNPSDWEDTRKLIFYANKCKTKHHVEAAVCKANSILGYIRIP